MSWSSSVSHPRMGRVNENSTRRIFLEEARASISLVSLTSPMITSNGIIFGPPISHSGISLPSSSSFSRKKRLTFCDSIERSLTGSTFRFASKHHPVEKNEISKR